MGPLLLAEEDPVNAAEWASRILSLITAFLALAMVPFVHRARVAAKHEGSLWRPGRPSDRDRSRALRCGRAAARWLATPPPWVRQSTHGTPTGWRNRGDVSDVGVALVVLLVVRWHLTPLLDPWRRTERALSVVLGTFQIGDTRPESLDFSTCASRRCWR